MNYAQFETACNEKGFRSSCSDSLHWQICNTRGEPIVAVWPTSYNYRQVNNSGRFQMEKGTPEQAIEFAARLLSDTVVDDTVCPDISQRQESELSEIQSAANLLGAVKGFMLAAWGCGCIEDDHLRKSGRELMQAIKNFETWRHGVVRIKRDEERKST